MRIVNIFMLFSSHPLVQFNLIEEYSITVSLSLFHKGRFSQMTRWKTQKLQKKNKKRLFYFILKMENGFFLALVLI